MTTLVGFFLRFIIFVSLALLINGLEISLSKRRCILPGITRNLEPASRLENSDHHSLHDGGLVSYDAPSNSCKQRYIVPVVWHVIIDLNKRGDVLDAILQRQIDILNGAFENTSLIFKTESVERIMNETWSSDCLSYIPQFQEILAQSTDMKLNLYTCALKNLNVLGHASYPWSHDEDSVYHGVVIHPGTLPGGAISPINEGDNLVHEVGHYFGLLHTFEGGCEGGDSVADTPATAYPSYDCPDTTPLDSCPHKPGYDPVHNYMGYNQDSCINHFTPGQVERIDKLLGLYRKNLKRLTERPCVIDSVFRWADGYIYFFAGGSYYRYDEISRGIDPGYPQAITEHWRGVPNNIDGVFRYANGITYFFKGSEYYRFNDSKLQVDSGYPKKIKEFWKGIPNGIDDVVRYSNGMTYFFKNDLYYRFNSSTATLDIGYPKQMKQYWMDIPKKVQAAFTWYNGGVFFFKDSKYWLFVPGQNSVDIAYPKSVKNWWSEEEQKYQDYNAFRHLNGYTYFICNKQYWRYNDLKNHIDYTYPHRLSNWINLPANIDGLFVWSDRQLYAFSGEFYYQVVFNVTHSIIRRNISSFWHGVPSHIDAVFRANDGSTYFFKDAQYYRFNDSQRQVDIGYPKPISSFWKGIPNDIGTVLRWSNGQTYFFKDNNYYRFNFTRGAVDDGYPRKISGAWRGVMYKTNSL
ncbi:zinc metalloprotease [Paramuricea clavata]|uniref:Zinc metalloprotease n=1 Tax=Paramuricea clavata TaxID=317549 RepID=A0A7D9EZB5_PARCT|nr:zinc metalloprotease [Paramuricea clavata]